MRNKILLIFLMVLMLAGDAWAAVTFDAVSAGSDSSGTTTSLTVSHSLGSGSGNNRIVLVNFTVLDTAETDIDAPTVTFNGTAMTQIHNNSGLYSVYGYYYNVLTYYILDANLPSSSGSYNVVGADDGGTILVLAMQVISLEGAKQEAPEEDVQTLSTTSGTSISQSITTVTNNAWIVTFGSAFFQNSSGMTWGTGQTERDDSGNIGVSTESLATAGSDTQSITWATTEECRQISCLSVAPATPITIFINTYRQMNGGN